MPEKIQTGLRIPRNQYEALITLSEEMGVSLNTLALMLIDVGMKAVNLGIQEEGQLLLRNLRDTYG